jgi:cobalt/nickel transport system permease protein
MHMADALLSPTVGGVMCAASAAAITHCSRRISNEADDRRVPLMGVLGAFLFAAQMINFSIPGTGSSGHLGGGLLLAILLGPHAAFLVFADGGLLALGCNIFNLGFFPAFVGYPLYRWIAGASPGSARATAAAMIAAIVSLQLGALAVVLETVASGISALPFNTFALFMLPIHLAIGIVEGVVTATVVSFVRTTRPGILPTAAPSGRSVAGTALAFLAVALVLGGVAAQFASNNPDGLEWSVAQAAGAAGPETQLTTVHARLDRLQQEIALLPHYGFRSEGATAVQSRTMSATGRESTADERLGASVAGLVGGALTLVLALLVGFALKARAGRR